MSEKSSIEWTESTWNPVTGCTKISDGCTNCYAERMAHRLKAMGQINYANGFNVTLHPHTLNMPLKYKKPHKIFVNSMSDLFHAAVPLSFIQEVFEIMSKAHWHRFQVLTKRDERLFELSHRLNWTDNIWVGVTVESSAYLSRIESLRNVPAAVKFLSLEPLLSPIPEINLNNIDWVIVGGESGPSARPMNKEWVINIQQNCQKAKVPFFFKQWGGVNKKRAGRLLNGKMYNGMPQQNNTLQLSLN